MSNASSGVASRILKGNFGQTRLARGGQWTNIATLHLGGGSEGNTGTVTVRTAYAPPFSQPINNVVTNPTDIPKVLIRITSGVLGVKTVSYTMCGTPKTVSGTDFYVEAQVFYDESGIIAAPGYINASVTAYFSEGEGQDLQPTTWVQSNFANYTYVGSFLTLYQGPGQLREVIGYNHGAAPTWLFFWDWPFPGNTAATAPTGPPPGGNNPSHPILIIPVPANAASGTSADPYFSFDAISSKKNFTYGLAFAASSTGDTYSYDSSALVHVEAEIYRGDASGLA